MAGFLTLQAYCEGCDTTVEVYADELFDFDCRCTTCDGLLVIQEGEEGAGGPAARADRPTQEDEQQGDEPHDLPLLGEPLRQEDRPTRADDEGDDPYALAARALFGDAFLDSVDEGRRERSTDRVNDPLAGSRPIEPLSTKEWAGALGALEPPRWDGSQTQQVKARAAAADQAEVEALVEVVEVASGTQGRGSRTYERDDLLPESAPPSEPPLEGLTTGGQLAAPAPAAPADDLGQLFPDLDWLALINDRLPEEEPEADVARHVIRLPEEAAPRSAEDAEEVRRFQETVTQVEAGGPEALDGLLSGTHARPAQRYEGTGALRVEAEQVERATAAGLAAAAEAAEAAAAAAEPQAISPDGETRPYGKETPAEPGAAPAEPQGHEATRALRAAAPTVETPVAADPGADPAALPFRKERLDPALVCARDVSSPQADVFRLLYQRIFHGRNGSSPRVVLITSPGRGEGKTTVAANLAIVAARIPGGGALLVDADPRGGGVMRPLGLTQGSEGLLEAIQSGRDARDFLRPLELRGLSVLPLGVKGSETAELIASSRTGEVLGALRGGLRGAAMIVDGSSVLESADPLVLSRSVDAVVLVVRAGRTQRSDVERALDLLGRERVLGVVINDAA